MVELRKRSIATTDDQLLNRLLPFLQRETAEQVVESVLADQAITLQEAAAEYGLLESTLRQWISRGRLHIHDTIQHKGKRPQVVVLRRELERAINVPSRRGENLRKSSQ